MKIQTDAQISQKLHVLLDWVSWDEKVTRCVIAYIAERFLPPSGTSLIGHHNE